MLGFSTLALGLLLFLTEGVSGILLGSHHRNNTAVSPTGRILLSNLIKDLILEPHANICTNNILSGGFMTLQNGTELLLDNGTVNIPTFLIRCSNTNETELFSPILLDFINSLNQYSFVDDTGHYLSKDPFEKSVLMIIFTSCAVCTGMWMVYLVIILLPAENHNGRRFSVQFYVLFTAIYEAVMLGKATNKIFKRQYEKNFQDSYAFEYYILDSNAYRIGEMLSSLMNFLNWNAIIFYMFHNYKRLRKNWLPSVLSNRNNLIIQVGVSLVLIDTTLFGISLWKASDQIALQNWYMVIDYIIYTLFCGLTIYFISHDFWFVLAPKRVQSTERIGIKSILILIWRDYHETIPLLLYNMTLFVLLYFTSIYFTVQKASIGQWHYKVVKFLRLIITVSVWGLIDVLERRELVLSRETVLGRKIHNNDEYFFDPKLPCGISESQEDTKSGLSRSQTNDSDMSLDGAGDGVQNSSNALLKHPLRVWKSQVRRARNLKQYSRAKHDRILQTITGRSNRKSCGQELKRKGRRDGLTDGEKIVSSGSAHYTVFKISDVATEDNNDEASMETELARNYIYDYNNNI